MDANRSSWFWSIAILLVVAGCRSMPGRMGPDIDDHANAAPGDASAAPSSDSRWGSIRTSGDGTNLRGSGSSEQAHRSSPQPPRTPSADTSGTSVAPVQEERTDAESQQQKLLGTWVAQDVDTSMGEVRIRLTFRQQGRMKLAAWSDIPFVGQVRDKTAPYEVTDSTISSDAIRGGTTVEYWFEGGDLIIRYKEGKTVRFTRQQGPAARSGSDPK
jgi:hypothetical protein